MNEGIPYLRVVNRPAFILTGILQPGTMRDGSMEQLWKRWSSTLALMRTMQPGHFYGAIDNIHAQTGAFDYMAAVATDSLLPIPSCFTRWSIPAKTYAIFTTSLRSYEDTRNNFYDSWLPLSGYCRAHGPEIEHLGPDFEEESGGPLDIWIPVNRTKSN
ncbi:MAG: GyrI-like domain-containing protein [Armatimonas sp.]